MANVIQTFPKGTGGGGGHTILDSSGTAAAQESNLQFTGLSVTDDSANGKTEVAGEGLNADSIDDIASANTINPAVIIGDANNYSTSEKIVGKWIDGKPLYQKTFSDLSITLNLNNSWQVITDISNLDIDSLIDGIFQRSKKTTFVPAEIDANGANLNKLSVLPVLYTNGSGTVTIISCTIYYTKTTDA